VRHLVPFEKSSNQTIVLQLAIQFLGMGLYYRFLPLIYDDGHGL
jgi:hypothetical protein